MRFIAVDWSGREDAAETIWTAEVRAGRLAALENGRSRETIVRCLADRVDEELVVGLDFAFSFPAWYCRRRGWATGPAVWAGVDDGLLRDAFPFWGRTGPRPAFGPDQPQRREDEARMGAKSVFQIGGAGAVGTGSIRGMPHLLTLRDVGFAVWPFDAPRLPLVVEIYPRALYPDDDVVKTRWRSRHDALRRWFPAQPIAMRERAAGSQDAFDAAVSALRMSECAAELAALTPVAQAAPEGRVWTPVRVGAP